jgi:hypothetical protein
METNHDEGPRGRAVLTANRWVGDVQYRPYSATGPIIADTGVRAVTLFELSDLVRLAETPDKAVILISGPCHGCKQSRSRALLPLLAEPSLRVWTHLVTDVRTASEVLEETA